MITRGLDDGAAADAAERLRSAIAQIAGGFSEHPDIRISASIGLTGWRFGEGLDDALLRADAACYEAKNTGRNRVRRAA
ncbi:diguanylate cyclase [Qipengyuania citrea]|uniref:diguanylate cyclase domain-containing protein n=1 Tax=Qipengyuania citrea TaxID=225971 RepID=UPI002E7B1B53|nr:diguanylate cyclase [Qipengyuania citrea]MCD1591686.1 diguanylate cyclase [Qipengyuania citrea]